MTDSHMIWKDQTKLRTGYTTGSCAAAAAKAAAHMLLTGEEIKEISLLTPAGIRLYLEVEDTLRDTEAVSCAIKKDSGDDPDVTNGIYVYAQVSRYGKSRRDDGLESEIILEAGAGIGRVTRKGLEQSIGEPAINRVPRQMILQAVKEEKESAQYQGCLKVLIWIPEGERLAAKTFNPKLGIEGGISVLGTSGIVEPMSEKALTDTIFLEMNVRKENGQEYCYVVPGNYGSDFLREQLGYEETAAVKCSNYIGEAIDDAVRLGMKGILLVGHIGKLIKLAAGIMNTHSRQADGRMEILAAHAAMAEASAELVTKLMDCITTTEALELLKESGILEQTMHTVMDKIEYHLTRRAGETLKIGAVMFSKEEGILGKTGLADELAGRINGRMETGRLYGIGVGPGDSELLTVKALRIIQECDVIAVPVSGKEKDAASHVRDTVVAYRIVREIYPEIDEKPVMCLPMPMIKEEEELKRIHRENAAAVAKKLMQGKTVAFLTLGDVTVYSTFLYLKKYVEEMGYSVEMIPGVPSFCAAAARLGIGLGEKKEQIHILPASYDIKEELALSGTKILMKAGGKMSQVIQELKTQGLEVQMVENCGMENESIYRTVREIPENAGYYSLMIVKEKGDEE